MCKWEKMIRFIFEFVNFIKKIKIKYINMFILKLYYICMWIYEENYLFFVQFLNVEYVYVIKYKCI